jgi:hypothetical protein
MLTEIIDARNMWSYCGSTYSTYVAGCVIVTLRKPVLEPTANPSHAKVSVLCKVLRTKVKLSRTKS